MNKKHYGARCRFWAKFQMAAVATMLCVLMMAQGHIVLGLVCLSLFSMLTARPQARTCAVTLSVPEIMMDVLDAFKLETPEIFGPNGFGTDFSSKTAVLNDKITAHISHVPTVGTYDPNNGGFKNASQDVSTLLEDVPVTLNQFPIVTVKVPWLTQLASKLPLYKEAIRNYGWALGKSVVDGALALCTPGNFSNFVKVPYANQTLDTWDNNIRGQLNTQKTFNKGRFALINTAAASQLAQDDRVRSSLFYGALNGDNGYRIWRNLAGFSWIREYPNMYAANNLFGFAGDIRSIVVASRRPDYANMSAEQLGVPQVMQFYPMEDAQSGLFMTGVAWQEQGTGDVYVACGILIGTAAGNQGGAAGTITDNAGVLLQTQ